jgi:hypothetical protein
MGKGSGYGPPKLARKRFNYWAHRMASYLQAQHHDVWRATMYPLPSVPTESEAKWNARGRNHIFSGAILKDRYGKPERGGVNGSR